MRIYVLLVFLSLSGVMAFGQGNGFSFTYTGPNQIIVGPDCVAELEWGHPNTPTASSNIPGGMIVSFDIYSISGGFQIGDNVGGGTTVTVFYQAIDNFGNSALFGFTIVFIDILPPVFDPFSLPDDLTVNCMGNFPVADVEVSDNCEDQDIVLTLTFTENNNADSCTGGTITRTWVADDDLGNQATFVQTITVLPDNTPPVIANNLVNGSAPCQNAMALYASWLAAQRAAFSATDNGCGVMTLSDNAPPASQITSFCGVITVTFTAKDNCDNISTVQKTFTVTNNVPPVINTPASDASGNCSTANVQQVFNNWINSHGGATATDDCSSIVWSTFPPSPSLEDTCDAMIEVLFIAGDGCGNFDTTAAGFLLTDDTPPTITVDPGTMFLSCSSSAVDSLLMDWVMTGGHSEASDFCTDADNLILGYRIGGLELTAQEVLDAWNDSLAGPCRDNVIIGGVGINNVLAYLAVEFTYDDACGNEGGETGYFGITDNGRPQFVSPPSDTSLTCAQNENWEDAFNQWYATAGNAQVMDACSDVTVVGNITADSAIQILNAALDTACQQGVSISISFSLADACGNMSLTTPSATFSLGDTLPPVLITPASDLAASCAFDLQLQLNNWLDTLGGAQATDGCGNLEWTFSWIDSSGISNSGAPGQGPYPVLEGLDCSDGLEVVFTVTDVCQNSIADTAFFLVTDTVPPVINIEEDSIHLTCGDTITIDTPQVTDDCNGDILITFQDIAGPDSCLGQPEVVTRIWTATDACGNSSSMEQIFFRIDSVPPVFELPTDSVHMCMVDSLELLNLSDNCDPAPVAVFSDVFTGSVCQQMLTRTWTVSDACGNSTTALQQFDLSDNEPPLIVNSPGHFIYSCDAGTVQEAYELWLNTVEIEDGCSEADYFIALPGTYVLEDTTTWPGAPIPDSIFLSCGNTLTIEADLVAFDICGNAAIESISFTVMDTTAPVINCPASIIVEPDTITCTGLVQLLPPGIQEICYPEDVKLTFLINQGDTLAFDSTGILDTIMEVGIHTVEWIASDCDGNISTCVTNIEIIDEYAVSLTCPSDTLLFTTDTTCADSLWVYPPVTTSGACAKGVVELRFEIEGNAFPDSFVFESPTDSVLVAFMAGIHEIFLIARDSTGDIDTCRYRVELRDTIQPIVECMSDTILLHPSGLDTIDVAVASLIASAKDNCGIDSIVYTPAMITCENSGTVVDVTVILFDPAGNSDTCVSGLFVNTQELLPLWERGLCDDTLRLFANIPPGPASNYTFNWAGPNGFISNEENPLLPGSDSTFNGIYTLTVQSENGCISSGSVVVNIESLAAPVLVVADDTICEGTLAELSTQSYSGVVTYEWYQISPEQDTLISVTNEPMVSFLPGVAGEYSYYAIVTQDTCTSEPSALVTVVVADVPEAVIGDVQASLCEYDTLFLSPEMVFDSLNYTWTGPGGFVSSEPLPEGIPVSEIDSPYVYILTVSNLDCVSGPDSISITIHSTPALPVISGDTLACESGEFSLHASPQAGQYLWIDPDGNTFLTTDSFLTVVSADTSHTGLWRVIALDEGCRSDTSAGVFVQVDAAIEIMITSANEYCEGDSIFLTITPAHDGMYTWGGPNGFTSQDPAPTTIAEEGVYTVFIQTPTGCEAQDTLNVHVDILPLITELFTDADTCADGMSEIRLWATTEPEQAGYIYNWSGPGGFISQDSSPVIANFNASLNGTYSLFIENGVCITDTSSFEISVKDSPPIPEVTGDLVYCSGDTIRLFITSPEPGGVYTWFSSDTTIVVPSPGTLIIPNAHQGLSGIYGLNVSKDGCVSLTAAVGIQVKSALHTPVIATAPLVCEGDSLSLTANIPFGATVQWFGPNGFTSSDINPVIFPATLQQTGEYYVFYSLNNCFSDTSQALLITVQPELPAPLIVLDQDRICIDDIMPVDLCIDQASGTQGAAYSWFVNGDLIAGSATDQLCFMYDGAGLIAGQNEITVQASLQGCESDFSQAAIIIGDEIPEVLADAGVDMEYCPGEVIFLDAIDPAPATGEWSAAGSIVFSDITDPVSSVEPLSSGMHQLVWTLSYESCMDFSSDSVLISIIPSPESFMDTVDVPFGQAIEFIATSNDSLFGIPFTVSIVTPPQKGNALHVANGIFRYSPNIGFVGTDMMVYRICSTDCPEECSEAVVILRIGNEDDCITPTLFTPNNDGVNDRLIIPCLETDRYPTNKIIVFNEWGDAVFTASPYNNDWEGTFSGDALPVGTYFYIMDFGDGSAPRKTFLVLER